MITFEVHRKVKDNVGDAFCNPSRYFNFENLLSGELVNSAFKVNNQNLIVGGGGLIHKSFQNHIQRLINEQPKHTVLWGIGHNFGRKHVHKSKEKVYYPDWIYNANLIGIRDWIKNYENLYLPCVSCMHPAFDKSYSVTHDVGFFIHAFKSKFTPTTEHFITNKTLDFDKTIEFIGSVDTLVTDSYHGAYWGQLLGKDVRHVNWSVKFDHFKYPATSIDGIADWKRHSPKYPPQFFLEECRNYNINFYNKVLDIFS